ncbi:MAG: hypothetical protein OXD50_14890 [Chloroflexi bacterium]|nr:hypothetical protein [Chloroflexota bacterium]
MLAERQVEELGLVRSEEQLGFAAPVEKRSDGLRSRAPRELLQAAAGKRDFAQTLVAWLGKTGRLLNLNLVKLLSAVIL